MKNKVQLITYPNSFGKDLGDLRVVLDTYLEKAVGGVHLLPFYPSSADRGFAPLTYDEVDPAFGTWADVDWIGERFDLVVDFMVNHISRQSTFFQDYLEKGEKSEYADMFLSLNKFAPNGDVDEAYLEKVYKRKPRAPYIGIQREKGIERIWCTFDEEQIDLDIDSPVTRRFVEQTLHYLADKNIDMVRVDAVGYSVKKLGTSCFFVEPEIWDVLAWLRDIVEPHGLEILPEVHEHFSLQLKLAERGYWVYDFALPILVLHALYSRSGFYLKLWLKICPRKQITTLDTHDGIGLVDVNGFMMERDIEFVIEQFHSQTGGMAQKYSTADYNNLDVYQVNCTYYSALGANDDAYILARAIQFFTPGIPQVYYVGLVAGANDIELVEKTGVGRDINRHPYSLDEFKGAVNRPVVRRLLRLMEFRNHCDAFGGEMDIDQTVDERLVIHWRHEESRCSLYADLANQKAEIKYWDDGAWSQFEP